MFLDDGGHSTEMMQITMEEMLPHVRAGGVYVIEDIHKSNNPFWAIAVQKMTPLLGGDSRAMKNFFSFTYYPDMLVIEKKCSSADSHLPGCQLSRGAS